MLDERAVVIGTDHGPGDGTVEGARRHGRLGDRWYLIGPNLTHLFTIPNVPPPTRK